MSPSSRLKTKARKAAEVIAISSDEEVTYISSKPSPQSRSNRSHLRHDRSKLLPIALSPSTSSSSNNEPDIPRGLTLAHSSPVNSGLDESKALDRRSQLESERRVKRKREESDRDTEQGVQAKRIKISSRSPESRKSQDEKRSVL
jgi:hypothetical protein